MGVQEHLHLDVAGTRQVALEVCLGAPEVGGGLAGRGLERRRGAVGLADDLQALAATAVRRLDRDRPAELLAEGDDVVDRLDRLEGPGDRRDAGRGRGLARRDLVAHDVDRFGRRADPGDSQPADGAGEVGVLGEEPVPGVDGVGPALLEDLEDACRVEVALGRGLAAERKGLVGVTDVGRVTVEVGEHREPVGIPSSRHVRMTRTAISPRFAMRILDGTGSSQSQPGGEEAAVSYGDARSPGDAWIRPAGRARRRDPAVRVDRLDEPLPPRRGPGGRTRGCCRRGRPPGRGPGPAGACVERARRARRSWSRCSFAPRSRPTGSCS